MRHDLHGARGLHARLHGRLFWRIYLHGLLLLALVAVAVASVAVFTRGGWWGHPERVATYAAEHVSALAGDPARLQAELDRARDVFGVEATVYARDGGILATTATPPLPLLTGGDAPRGGPARFSHHGFGYAVSLAGGGQALFVGGAARSFDPTRPLLFFAAVLVALMLGSLPLARSIAAPVERLTQAARRLGEGDLAARSGVRARGEVGELGRAFDEMAERLERLVRSEQELLANVSHELRTPLARIRVALELAAEGDLDRARRFLGEIGADLDELDGLIEDVLTAARLDLAAGGGAGLPLRKAPVDLAPVLADAAERFRAAWPERILEWTPPPALPPLDGDAALLRRLFGNLLDNAAKYSEAPAPVVLAARAEAGAAVVEVRDRGIGIDPADLPRLFTPFFRTDRSRARGTGGVGLGLALARRIARAHGGDVELASADGEGSVMRVRLPTDPGRSPRA
jgi:two-component system, OmpR family, sensor kinase